MELKATKEYGAIRNLLESIEEQIENEIGKLRKEISEKYKLDIIKKILNFATDVVRSKINLIIKDAISNFDWFNIYIDCAEIDLNMNEIEAIISRVSREMKDIIPNESAPEDIEIILKKYIRKVICKVPTKWTTPVVLQFLKRFEEALNQLSVVIS
ncbi:MAG TPA: hypothetical protein VMV49_07220 [Candidatus Deferrimicrobium sp.]|nr:hypothetical protein [Candidatus Deferrimicrobium sp.]